jgi:hypothetical protein
MKGFNFVKDGHHEICALDLLATWAVSDISGKLWSGEGDAETGLAPLPLQDILSEAWAVASSIPWISCSSDLIVYDSHIGFVAIYIIYIINVVYKIVVSCKNMQESS